MTRTGSQQHPAYTLISSAGWRMPTGAQPARLFRLNVLAARNVCLQSNCSAQENLELPRVHQLY